MPDAVRSKCLHYTDKLRTALRELFSPSASGTSQSQNMFISQRHNIKALVKQYDICRKCMVPIWKVFTKQSNHLKKVQDLLFDSLPADPGNVGLPYKIFLMCMGNCLRFYLVNIQKKIHQNRSRRNVNTVILYMRLADKANFVLPCMDMINVLRPILRLTECRSIFYQNQSSSFGGVWLQTLRHENFIILE